MMWSVISAVILIVLCFHRFYFMFKSLAIIFPKKSLVVCFRVLKLFSKRKMKHFVTISTIKFINKKIFTALGIQTGQNS